MIPWFELALAGLALAGLALFAGAQTAMFRASRVRLERAARAGSPPARLALALLGDESALALSTLLGLEACAALLAWVASSVLAAAGAASIAREAWIALVLAPFACFCALVLPKELCRRRPTGALVLFAPWLAAARWLLYPLERALFLVAEGASRGLGLRVRLHSAAQGREAVGLYLEEGRRGGSIAPRAETMARNALRLRSTPVGRCAVAWKDVVALEQRAAPDAQYRAVAASSFTRLPVVDASGGCVGYVHQLDVLGAGETEAPLAALRPILAFPGDLPVDRALARLRAAGSRIALVGSPAAPLGIVTLKDLLEEISGDLAGW